MDLPRYFRIGAATLIALMLALQIASMLDESQTWDEGIHLLAGYAYLRTGTYTVSPEHPPLGRILCALPLLALDLDLPTAPLTPPGLDAAREFLYRNRLSPDIILAAARSMTVLLTVLFAAWLAWWTARRFGPVPALIALALFCFDPNIIAHGRYVTTDLIAALTIFLTCTLWIDYLDQPTRLRLVLAGGALGAALASKNSALFLIPVVIALGLWKRRFKGTLAALALAFAVLVVVYAPEMSRITHAEPLSTHLQRKGLPARLLAFTADTLHLPYWSYLDGIDQLLELNDSGEPAYLLGQTGHSGWWYYFPVAFLVKTPVGTLAAIFLALALAWRTRPRNWILYSLAAIPLVFFAICVQSHITIGHRHILPIYAFLFVLVGITLARYRRAAIVLTALVAVESLAIYPYYLSFFNRAAGGPLAGSRYLVDSNLDWGQDGKRLGAYMASHRIRRVCLSYFGNLDYLRYGIEFDLMPARPEDADCIAAVSATSLQGLYGNPNETAWLRTRRPDDRVGYSIFLYDLRKHRD